MNFTARGELRIMNTDVLLNAFSLVTQDLHRHPDWSENVSMNFLSEVTTTMNVSSLMSSQ